MNIQRNEENECRLLESVRKHLDEDTLKRPQGIHVSDLTTPLKSYYQKKLPKPLTEDEVGYFISGKVMEEMLNNFGILHDSAIGGGATKSKHGSWNDISFEIDFVLNNIPMEFKTSRQKIRYPSKALGISAALIDDLDCEELKKEFDLYIQQLKKYMVIQNSLKGQLYVFFLNLVVEKGNVWKGSAPPRFRCYDLELSQEELEEEESKMINSRKLLTMALNGSNPILLPKCPGWMCGSCKWHKNPCEGNLPHALEF